MIQPRVVFIHKSGLHRILGCFDPETQEIKSEVAVVVNGESTTACLVSTDARRIMYKEVDAVPPPVLDAEVW